MQRAHLEQRAWLVLDDDLAVVLQICEAPMRGETGQCMNLSIRPHRSRIRTGTGAISTASYDGGEFCGHEQVRPGSARPAPDLRIRLQHIKLCRWHRCSSRSELCVRPTVWLFTRATSHGVSLADVGQLSERSPGVPSLVEECARGDCSPTHRPLGSRSEITPRHPDRRNEDAPNSSQVVVLCEVRNWNHLPTSTHFKLQRIWDPS